jgi:NADH-quinone oxidoreductase subunit N
MTTADLASILPVSVVGGWACLLLLVDQFIPRGKKGWTAFLAAGGLAAALGVLVVAPLGRATSAFGGMIAADGFAAFLQALFLLSGLLVVPLTFDYLRRVKIERGEYYVLLLFSLSGMMLMAQAGDLAVVFLALELLSLPLYVMAAIARPKLESEESGMKYFLLGAFASALLVYGIALVYGATGSTRLEVIFGALQSGRLPLRLLLAGAALILVGLGFKVAAVPFHMWTPDVYHGAPSPASAFMSVGAKAAGFAALLRVFLAGFPELSSFWSVAAMWISALTMTWGNVAAIAQSNIKRMLAYSSIAHAGYILMALAASANPDVASPAASSAVFYLLAYAVTNLGAWGVVIALEGAEGQGLAIDGYAGLSKKRPWVALAMAVFMLSLTGVPPTVGFLAKFYLFRAVLDAGLIWLALVGVVTSLVSAYYYLRVVVVMYMRSGELETRSEPWLNGVIALTGAATLLLGLFPGPVLGWAEGARLLAGTP